MCSDIAGLRARCSRPRVPAPPLRWVTPLPTDLYFHVSREGRGARVWPRGECSC